MVVERVDVERVREEELPLLLGRDVTLVSVEDRRESGIIHRFTEKVEVEAVLFGEHSVPAMGWASFSDRVDQGCKPYPGGGAKPP
ncbi:hypothetical protein GCM10022206_90610 [Streptomyces chiangmaiensis]